MPQGNPRPGEKYVHFKGNLYQVLTIARDAASGKKMVVYQALYGDFSVYVRPYNEFIGEVDRKKYPQAEQTFRFRYVEAVSGIESRINSREPSADRKNSGGPAQESSKERETFRGKRGFRRQSERQEPKPEAEKEKDSILKEEAAGETGSARELSEEKKTEGKAAEGNLSDEETAAPGGLRREGNKVYSPDMETDRASWAQEEPSAFEASDSGSEPEAGSGAREETADFETAGSRTENEADDGMQEETAASDPEDASASGNEEPVNPWLIKFLDAETLDEKYRVLGAMYSDIDDKLIDDLAVCLDVAIPEGKLQDRYMQLRQCIRTKEKYEAKRY